MTAFTNRRYYSIHLVPVPSSYTPILSFRFPDDEAEAEVAASAVEAVTARTGIPVKNGQLVVVTRAKSLQ